MANATELAREAARTARMPLIAVLLWTTPACGVERSASGEDDDLLEVAAPPSDPDTKIACSPGRDATCNGHTGDDWLAGRCLPDGTCQCAAGSVVHAETGKCVAAPWVEGSRTTHIAVAAGRDEAALVTIGEIGAGAPAAASLRWIDGEGRVQGEPVVLSARASEVAVATDGERYVACWTNAPMLECGSIAPGETKATPMFSAGSSRAPAVAFSAGTWLVAFLQGSGDDVRTRLAGFVADRGISSELVQSAGRAPSRLVLTARPGGFVVVAGEPMSVYSLDLDLRPKGTPVPLSVSMWSYGAAAATATRVAVSLARPYGASLFLIEPSGEVTTKQLAGGGRVGLPVALRAQGDGLMAAWSDESQDPSNQANVMNAWHDVPVDVAANPDASWRGRIPPFAAYELGGRLFVASAPYAGARILRRP